MVLFWLGLFLPFAIPLVIAAFLAGKYVHLCRHYLPHMKRIFVEPPLFLVPHCKGVPGAEDVTFDTTDGLRLRGCYLRTPHPRRGVVLFGLEFGSERWACWQYCSHLVAAGFDVFAFEPRNQGDSDKLPGYEPLHWVTDYEVEDTQAALAYLKARPDADPRGVGFFGISKGAGAGLIAAAGDPSVRCVVTDGAFGTYSTVVPYMRQWYLIYNRGMIAHGLLPSWYYGSIGLVGIRQVERERHCRFAHLEKALPKLAPRPWLLIHGENDTYIRPEMAWKLYQKASHPKEWWLVPDAKHNHALQTAGDEYRRRVLAFFEANLADPNVSGSSPRQEQEPVTVGHQS